MTPLVVSFACGVVFAIGLGIGGMTHPFKVVGFLDFAGAWDPSLAFVMAGAIAVYGGAWWLARPARPLLVPEFQLPGRRDLDAPLVVGSALFGIGWGLGGYCPGPAVASLASGKPAVLLFVASMIAGVWLHGAVGRLLTERTRAVAATASCDDA